MLSLDVVGIVASYISHRCIVNGAQPRLLGQFRPDLVISPGQCTAIVYSPDGNIWIARSSDYVYVFDVKGKFLFHVKRRYVHCPSSIACDTNGEVFVANSSGRSVAVFSLDGTHVRTINGRGRLRHLLRSPRLVAVDGNGLVFVVSRVCRVEVFHRNGSYVKNWYTSSYRF